MKKVVSLLLCVMLILMISACGEAEKTPTTTPQKTEAPAVDYAPYKAKIEEYAMALRMDEDTFFQTYGEPDCSSINGNVLMLVRIGEGTISYTRHDVDSNGVEELLFSDGATFIDAYTLNGGRVIKLYEDCYFGYRTILSITPKGEWVVHSVTSAWSACMEIGKLNGAAIEKTAAYYCDETGASDDYGDARFVSEDEFSKLAEKYSGSIHDSLTWTEIKR